MAQHKPIENPWGDFVAEILTDIQEKPKRRHKVLVVDDSSVVRNELKHFLTGRCDVIEAIDGIDALSKIQAHGDALLIFLDVNMPNMDGIVMAEKYAEEVAAGRLVRIPMVMLTTESTKEKVVRAKKAGVIGWVIKPAKREHIVQIFDKFAAQDNAAAKKTA